MTTDNRGIPASFIQAEARDPAEAWPGAPPNFGQPLVPHIATVSGMTGGAGRAYSWADEALRDSRENADKMLTDCGITECLEARLRSTALLNWHIAPENENSSDEKALADEMTKIIQCTPHFAKFRWAMGLARWYGRYAVCPQYGVDWVNGKQRTVVTRWEPRHGDKLVFRYDDGSHRTKADQVGIRIGGAHTWIDTDKRDYRGNDLRQIESTNHGLVYWLTDKQRRLIVVNKHIIEDGPFEDPLRAGAIHGIGIRDRIYWTWYGMVECLADILCYLERSAFGIEIWTYPANNDAARRRTEDAAKKVTSGGRTVLIVPKFSGENADQFGVQHIEPGLGGVEQAMTIVREYFGHKIKRYILGQTLTSEADATGLGSGVADAHLATFADIIRWDALNDQETLTEDKLRWLQLWNFPTSRGIKLRLIIDTDSPDAEKKMKGYESAWGMGARIKEEDVLSVIGASVPKSTDKVLLNPAVSGQQGAGGNFGGIGFNQPQGQRPPLPDSQQEAIKRMADVEKFINGVSLGKIMADRHTYTLNLEEAARHTATPTEAQAKAGNYRKGKTSLHGLTISIENAKGTRRKPEWPELSAHYGYINRTTGRDGDHVDVFVGPNPDSELVFVIDQQTASGRFDEHKCILGTTSRAEALELYAANYPTDWMIGPVTAMTVEQFKTWLKEGDTTKPVGAQVSKYEARWVTIGGRKQDDAEHRGGFPVQIDGEGRILKGGPKALQGKHVSEIGKHFEAERAARAKSGEDKFADVAGFFDDIKGEHKAAALEREKSAPGNTRSLKKIIAHQASAWGMDEDTYAGFMDEVWADELDRQRQRENVKESARTALGIDAGTLKRIQERGGKQGRGGDYSHVSGIDSVAQELKSLHPDLFTSGNDEQDLWDLVIEGKQAALSKTSREFHDAVDERLQAAMTAAGNAYTPDDDYSHITAENFTYRGPRERYAEWKESDHPRDESGQFTEGEGFQLSSKPKKGKTLDIKLQNRAKQMDLFAGRGDAPGQTSFFDDIDPKAKNVKDQKETAASPDAYERHISRRKASGQEPMTRQQFERNSEFMKGVAEDNKRVHGDRYAHEDWLDSEEYQSAHNALMKTSGRYRALENKALGEWSASESDDPEYTNTMREMDRMIISHMKENGVVIPDGVERHVGVKGLAAASFAELQERHPELAKFSDSPDPLPKVKGGQIAHMTDRQHEIYSDLAKAKSAGNITEEEWKAGLAAIRGMDVPGNQIGPPTVKSKLFSAMKRAKG